MDRILFSVNGVQCSVGPEVDSDVSLNDYIRYNLNLPGTKYMCKEGGCGACVVAVTAADHNGHRRTFSVNSCLVSIMSCQDWQIKTTEGIGDRRIGYHPIQKTLAEYNGTQCGYCSPGWVMSMYSLLESNHELTQYEIENSFGSNTCRCTGYRPILDAFKSFAKDAPEPKLVDIEDLKTCNDKYCKKSCDKSWCIINKTDTEVNVKKIVLKDNRTFYRIKEINDIFSILDKDGVDSYMLIAGNTGRGAVPIFSFPKILIDISAIQEIKGYYIDQNLIVGAGTTLTDLLDIFLTVSKEHEEFSYLKQLYEHLDLVAHIPVRNIGTIAGNLMTKHVSPSFSSDVFLLFEAIGAVLTIAQPHNVVQLAPEDFLAFNMTGKVITHVHLPPLLSKNYKFTSLKIMPRAQNAHAQVNAAFLYQFDHKNMECVKSARIVFGGLSAKFNRARCTEQYLESKKIFTNEILQGALKILHDELVIELIAGDLCPEYKKKCALGLFYKGLLQLIPEKKLKPTYRSGAKDFRRTRPLSKGIEVYDTNPVIWPINEPMPKKDAVIQCAGEAAYINDLPTQHQELFCAFVTADVCLGEIESIDPSPALSLPGVVAFFSAKDIPGRNSYLSQKVPTLVIPDEVFAEKKIKFYDQAIGMIVAETEKLANRAALLIRVKYKVDKRQPLLTISDVRKEDISRITLILVFPARDRGAKIQKVFKGGDNIDGQYHYTMETLSCTVKPSEDGIDVAVTAQWPDLVHIGISECLNIEQSRINLSVPRCGGAFGFKISRPSHVACACALAAYLLNRPCRFVMSLQASMRVIGKRLPASSDYEVGVSNSGEIQYLEYHFFENVGYAATDAVTPFAISSLKNCYNNRRWQYKIFNVTTDTPANTYMRAPGELEAIALTEHIMERISYEVNEDPVQVRLNNIEPLETDTVAVVEMLMKDSEYNKRKEETEKFNNLNRWKKRGLRVAFLSWPAPLVVDYHVLLSIYHGDGTVSIAHGGMELGQGINTKVIQVAAYTLNISMDKIKIKTTTVEKNPNLFSSGGSRTTHSVSFGVIKCCQIIMDRLTVVRETLNDPTWEVLIEAAFNRGINLQASYRVTANDQDTYRAAGAAVTEVELDVLTGEHEVLRVDIIEDVGLSVNPELDVGQVEGAFIMGLGYWTHEHLDYDVKTGEILTDRSWNYHVPLAKDIPIDFRVKLRRNSFNPVGTLGAKAVSEPPICLAVSVAFALRQAIGSSRADSGYPKNEWFQVDGPYTLAVNVLKSDVKLEEFLFD